MNIGHGFTMKSSFLTLDHPTSFQTVVTVTVKTQRAYVHFLFRSVVAVYTGTQHSSSVICYYGSMEAFGRAHDTNK